MCLTFSGNIIYSEGAPQAKAGGGKKRLVHTGLIDFEICPALNEWVDEMRGVSLHRC